MAEDHGPDRAQQRRRPWALAVATLLAVSVAGLAVAAPLLLLSSPVPGARPSSAALLAALTATGMAVSGSLAAGATTLLWHLASAAVTPPDYVELGKRRVAEVAGEQTAQIDAGPAINPGQVARSRRPYGGSHALIS